jgi:hypothetical protein
MDVRPSRCSEEQSLEGPVPLHPLLAEFMLRWKQKTTYSQASEWVFPSTRLNGKQPRIANMLEDHLRPAAVKAGILSSHPDNHGRLVDDDLRRFGFHAVSRDRMVAAGKMLTAILSHAPDKNGLTAD